MSAFPQRPFLGGQHRNSPPPPTKRFVLSAPYVHGRVTPTAVSAEEDIPSIDDFLDHSPPIEQFAPSQTEPAPMAEWSWGGEAVAPHTAVPAEPKSDWEAFDWGSAASLGNAPPDAAAEAWASTDWSEPRSSKESRQTAAESLAHALDQIARRIRAGELRVPGPETVQDDAAMTATLAALLGVRR
jgi:hypothetical protein